MQQDIWINTTTNTSIGVTGPLGSPRAWLRRALDVASLDDTAFHQTSITPHEISVAGIWYLPVTKLPVTDHRELIRWFEAPAPEHIMTRTANRIMQPIVGIATAVPMHEVMACVKLYRESDAAYVWWKTPQNKSVRACVDKPKRRQLDHNKVYKMLDSGMRPADISRVLGFPTPNIDYVAKKWRQGIPLIERQTFVDQAELCDTHREGTPVGELAVKFNVSPAYIYSILKKEAK